LISVAFSERDSERDSEGDSEGWEDELIIKSNKKRPHGILLMKAFLGKQDILSILCFTIAKYLQRRMITSC